MIDRNDFKNKSEKVKKRRDKGKKEKIACKTTIQSHRKLSKAS
jgi:hypothetical protein